MSDRYSFGLVPVLTGFLLFGVIFGCPQMAAQNVTDQTLTVYLKELNTKYGERVSFSPTITDRIHPNNPSVAGTLEEALESLLKDTGLGAGVINGYYYIYIKKKELSPVVTAPVPAAQEEKPEERQQPLPAIVAAPLPPVFPKRVMPAMEFRYPVVKRPALPQKPVLALKTNLLYDATATLNLGVEFAIAKKWTLDVSGNYNPWSFSGSSKWKHVMLQPEVRYWTCERFNGHFVGAHLHGGAFNAGALPALGGLISDNMQQNRYQGYFYGGGLSYGYYTVLSAHWGLEASLGLGYARINYDKYPCGDCGTKIKKDTKNYFGPTKVAISLIYNIK